MCRVLFQGCVPTEGSCTERRPVWTSPVVEGIEPTARAGHSLTDVGGAFLLMGGVENKQKLSSSIALLCRKCHHIPHPVLAISCFDLTHGIASPAVSAHPNLKSRYRWISSSGGNVRWIFPLVVAVLPSSSALLYFELCNICFSSCMTLQCLIHLKTPLLAQVCDHVAVRCSQDEVYIVGGKNADSLSGSILLGELVYSTQCS